MKKPRLTILTRAVGFHPLSKEWLSSIVKKVIGRVRGPEAVFRSLVDGLKEAEYAFNVNPLSMTNVSDKVVVLSGVDALEQMIDAKQNGSVKTLFAGPNVAVSTKDFNSILESNDIDKIIVNSEWTKDHTIVVSPALSNKVIIWPCGVKVPDVQKKIDANKTLIYKKNVSEEVLKEVTDYFSDINQPFEILEYGSFSQQKYFNTLKETEVLIYLQNSESQGLAMFEAWARNIPTLVYEHGVFTDKNGNKTEGKISAPYLTQNCGLSFKKAQFKEVWHSYQSSKNSFSPRAYINTNFTDKITALNLINEINNV